MAWNLGLVRGTARGLAREADRKYSDHIRQMNTEPSQLDALIGQLRYNKEARYRQERDAVDTRRWNIVNTRDAARHEATMESIAYEKSQRPIREKRATDEHTWRGQRQKWGQEEHTWRGQRQKWGQEEHTWRGQRQKWGQEEHEFMYGDSDTPGYRELQRDEAGLRLGATRRNEAWLTSPEGQAYTQRMRVLGKEQLESGNELNRARAWALRNPQRAASTAKPKTLTYTDVRNIGEKLPSTRTMLKDHGTEWNPLNWGHKYLPWTAPMGEKSLTSQLQSSGIEAGQRLRRQTPGGIAIHELEQHIGALWEGMLSQEIDGKILPDALFNDVPENLQSKRMNDAYRVFRAGVREGLGLPIEDTGDASQGLFEEFMGTEAPDGENIGEVDTSFWGTIAPPVVPSAAIDRWKRRE